MTIKICPKCGSNKTKKDGKENGVQFYFCYSCESKFKNNKRKKNNLIKKLWFDYVFRKQVFRELSNYYNLDKRIVRNLLNQYHPPFKQHHPRPVHILVDATYFGPREEGKYWCVLVARDANLHEDLVWLFTDTETTLAYTVSRETLEEQGYTILSVTGDGFSGLKAGFFNIPYQMCQVHMERLVTAGTTKKPQTEAGQVLLALIRTIHDSNSYEFLNRFKLYLERYRDFLNEKSFNPETGRQEWTHRELRKAVLSLNRLKKYLFIFEQDKNIPKTTNSLEGHFSHIKDILEIHRGVNKQQAKKIIHSILLASTIAPNEETKKKII